MSVVAVGTCFFEYSDFVFTCDRHLGEEGGSVPGTGSVVCRV
jgi:hypothetical protein